MSSKLRTEVFPTTGRIVIGDLNNFLMLVQTASAVTFRYYRDGTSADAENIDAGYVKGLVRPWERAELNGTAGSTVRFLVGLEEVQEDFTDYRRTVGVFQQQLSAGLQAPTIDVDVGSSAAAIQLAATNLARRKVTVGLLDTATVSVRVGPSATIAANRGGRLSSGQSYTYEGTDAVYAIREAAGVAAVWVLEELY